MPSLGFGFPGGPISNSIKGYVNNILADQPLCYYEYKDTGGNVLTATVGANGYASTGVLWSEVGPTTNKTPNLAAKTQGFSSGAPSVNQGTSFTIEQWVKGDPGGNWSNLCTRDNTGNRTWVFRTFGGNFSYFQFPSFSTPISYPTTIMSDGGWHHLVITNSYNSGANLNTTRLYIDGVLRHTVTNPSAIPTLAEPIEWSSAVSGTYAGGPGWAGWMAHCAIYGKALTATRILAHFQAATN